MSIKSLNIIRYHCTSIVHTFYTYMVPYISFTYTYIHHQTLLWHFKKHFFSKTPKCRFYLRKLNQPCLGTVLFFAESWDVGGNCWIQVPFIHSIHSIHLKSILNTYSIHWISISNPPKNQNLSMPKSEDIFIKTNIPFFVCFMDICCLFGLRLLNQALGGPFARRIYQLECLDHIGSGGNGCLGDLLGMTYYPLTWGLQ